MEQKRFQIKLRDVTDLGYGISTAEMFVIAESPAEAEAYVAAELHRNSTLGIASIEEIPTVG